MLCVKFCTRLSQNNALFVFDMNLRCILLLQNVQRRKMGLLLVPPAHFNAVKLEKQINFENVYEKTFCKPADGKKSIFAHNFASANTKK